jgi:hypothetical protein
MRYLKRFNEKVEYKDLENLIFDIKDLEYELGDMNIKMIIKPDPELDPIKFNMLRHYLSGSLPDTGRSHSDFIISLSGDFNSLTATEGGNIVRIIEHIKSILSDFGLSSEIPFERIGMLGSDMRRLSGLLVTQLNTNFIAIKITKP